ncbi:MAG TPA: hypothetical protein VMW87_08065 [Spirochaetia bacterium]|nr:hypothetical protein [Spirochaetia bacterium]
MKRAARITLLAALLTALFALGSAFSQNLLDNDAYRKAVQLRQQAQVALDSGQYDQAQQLSQQAEQYAKEAIDTAKQLELAYRATNWLERARERIKFGESIKASERYATEWQTAQAKFTAAQDGYQNKQYQDSIVASQAVLDALRNIQPAKTAVVAQQPATQVPTQPALPEYYVVRLIPNRTDCFWQIAGYPFVYGDPLKWPLLYKENMQILQDPKNPDLIQPGMVFKIPSVNGEKRQGTYKPDGQSK